MIPSGAVADQTYAAALALCQHFAGKDGVVRPHGGGFAGTILALVPETRLAAFVAAIDGTLGSGSCTVANISEFGGTKEEV